MKQKLLLILGAIALLAAGFVVAAQPAAAATVDFTAYNVGLKPVDVTATSPCGEVAATVPGNSERVLGLDPACNYVVTGTDPAGLCRVEGASFIEDPTPDGYRVPVNSTPDGAVPRDWDFIVSEQCIEGSATIEIEKDVPASDGPAAALTTFTFAVTPFDLAKKEALADGGPCSDRSTHSGAGETSGFGAVAEVVVVAGYVADNLRVHCSYAVSEIVPAGWTLTEVDSDGVCDEQGIENLADATVLLTPATATGEGNCEAEFKNELDPVPLTVTKTFTGREYYTTVDRADFHLFTPGLCGTFAIDPFGGLLGSVGLFRTVNASQRTQIVIALPDTVVAGPNGACTYRIQENGTPDGCAAIDPDGSDADGPYWEATWVAGETTSFEFHIVNDCGRPEPTPTATPSPTADPAKKDHGAKQAAGSGVPKFTG